METQQNSSPRKNAKRLSRTWTPFIAALAVVLERLEEDQYLIITAKRSHRFVQFAGLGSFGLRIEAISNHYLDKAEMLNRRQVAALKSIGWNGPTGNSKSATPKKDPDGSPNFFIDFELPVQFDVVAQLAVRTLAEVFELPNPIALEYKAFNADGVAIQLPSLGLRQENSQAQSENVGSLQSQMLDAMRTITGISDLEADDDGDVSVQYGVINICVVGMHDPSWIRIFSVLLREAKETPALLSKLNSLNDGAHRLRYFLHDEKVYAVTDVLADPFVESHLAVALRDFNETAESVAILLQAAEFSGRSFLDMDSGAVLKH